MQMFIDLKRKLIKEGTTEKHIKKFYYKRTLTRDD